MAGPFPIGQLTVDQAGYSPRVGLMSEPENIYSNPQLNEPPLADDTTDPPRHVCQEQGCTSSFGRRSELQRHMRKHDGSSEAYSCPAQGCPRSGSRSFKRSDKLKDHILQGHDEDDLFCCPEQDCQRTLTRDLFAIHFESHFRLNMTLDVYRSMTCVRVCPMPKCSTRMKLGNWRYLVLNEISSEKLVSLKTHLLEKHELRGREAFKSLLANRGFEYASGDFLCPICTKNNCFATSEGFEEHIVRFHLNMRCKKHQDEVCHCAYTSPGTNDLWTWKSIPDEIRHHRRTILFIFPLFKYLPLWDDIKVRHQLRQFE